MNPEILERAAQAAYDAYRQGTRSEAQWDSLSDAEKQIARDIALAVIGVVMPG